MEKYNLNDTMFIMVNNEGYIGPLKTQGPIISPVKVSVKIAKNLVIGGYKVHQYDKESGKIIQLTESNVMDKNKFRSEDVKDTSYNPEPSDSIINENNDEQKTEQDKAPETTNTSDAEPVKTGVSVNDDKVNAAKTDDTDSKNENAEKAPETTNIPDAEPVKVESKNENNKNQKPWKNKNK